MGITVDALTILVVLCCVPIRIAQQFYHKAPIITTDMVGAALNGATLVPFGVMILAPMPWISLDTQPHALTVALAGIVGLLFALGEICRPASLYRTGRIESLKE